MSIKILTQNAIDNTNIDGARQNHFSAGMKSGIVKGAFNEGNFFASASNVITLDTCELRISGHQILIDSAESITLSNAPTTATRYSLIAEIKVSDTSVPSFRLFVQQSTVELIQQNLFKTEKGNGTYQLKIGNFTLGTDGKIIDVIRVADLITGSGQGAISDIKFNATATQLSSSSQPEANVDYNEDTGEYDMLIGIPSGGGTNVTVGGVIQQEFNADEKADTIELNKKSEVLIDGNHIDKVSFTSDPQEQLNGIEENLENKANIDASNLTEANVESWKDKLDINTVVLWQNPDSAGDSSFSPQTITLSQARTNFTHLIVEWKVETIVNTIFTQLFKSTGGIKLFYGNGGSNGIGSRDGSFSTDTTITWTGAIFNKNSSNTEAIPLRILGVNL